jgi:hypothetical protein
LCSLAHCVANERSTARIARRVLKLVILFTAGFALGSYTGAGAMRAGFAMTALGVLLTIVIIALGR